MSELKNNRLQNIRVKCEFRREFAQQLRALTQKDLTLHEMRLAVQMLRSFPEPTESLKIAVLGSYTTDLLRDYWTFHALLHGFEIDLYFAPYGQVIQELHHSSALSKHQADFIYLLLQWSDIVPALAEPMHAWGEKEKNNLIQRFVSSLIELITTAQNVAAGTIVLSFLSSFCPPGLGLYDVMAEFSDLLFRSRLKHNVSALLREQFPSIYFDDGDHLLSTLGVDGIFDPRLWYTSRFPFSVKGANLFVYRLLRFPVLSRTPKVKCLVLDCDNTLWGGIIGEDGMRGIDLGPDYPGCCYVAFQRRLLDFLHRGFLLSICSKNNLSDVQQVIREHPHMVLREGDFAAIRINWEPKPDNLRSIADELRLGLDSFLFIDDSPHECRMVSKFLPAVRVVQVPERPLDIPTCLNHLQELELLSFTSEDRDRFKMYVQNRQRLELAATCKDVSEYLASLHMKMRIYVNFSEHIVRLAQMTQKTNQFNLTTRRYSEQDIQSFIEDPDWSVAYFSLSDIFGNNGIVGLMLLTGMTTDRVEIDTFLISCRVIGRKAEEAFLYQVLKLLRKLGKTTVTARYIPTAKNSLVENFWDHQDFLPVGEGIYEFRLKDLPTQHSSLVNFQIQFDKENL